MSEPTKNTHPADSGASRQPAERKQSRQKRLGDALRANLKRRKQAESKAPPPPISSTGE